jgi:two-component sensor histidine kinase
MAETAREAQRRELLLREMHHRVKNNFQVILAMIAHQTRNAPDEVARRIAQKIGEGVFAMSLAHDQLSPTQESESVQLRTYLKALVTSIEKPLENITIEIQAEDIEAGIDQAVPIGLIVNEAVTNAVKHAFDPESGGAIRIVLRPSGRAEALLEIADNGRGAESGGEGSGSKLMEALARQMLGRLTRTSDAGGTTITLNFPRIARA